MYLCQLWVNFFPLGSLKTEWGITDFSSMKFSGDDMNRLGEWKIRHYWYCSTQQTQLLLTALQWYTGSFICYIVELWWNSLKKTFSLSFPAFGFFLQLLCMCSALISIASFNIFWPVPVLSKMPLLSSLHGSLPPVPEQMYILTLGYQSASWCGLNTSSSVFTLPVLFFSHTLLML